MIAIRKAKEKLEKLGWHRLTLFMKYGGVPVLLVGLTVGWHLFSPVSAAPTANIVYSTDGGNSWSTTPTVKSGQEVLTRSYFNNDGSSNVSDAQMSTTLPAGFSLVPNSTRTCLNPGTTNPANPTAELACNDSSGQGGAINEGAVWSGNTLAVAPNAGLYGTPTNATSGLMAAGKKRYLNLHQCLRTAGVQYIMVAIDDPIATDWYASTNASNTADSTYNCGTNTGGWTLHGSISAVQNLDLLGKRYVNLHQCLHYYSDANGTRYITTLVNNPTATNWGTGTNTANTANVTVSCVAPGSGWTFHSGISEAQPLDTLNNRYVNIHECLRVYTSGYYLSAFINNPSGTGWRTGTNASNTAATVLDCPVVSGWPSHSTLSDFQAIDTSDTTRGQGFVEYKMIAPAVTAPQTLNQTATLTGTGTGNPTGTGSLTVEPDMQLVYSTDGGSTWTADPVVDAGANLRVRVFSHNKRNLTAIAAQFGTTLPAGFTRVLGSTHVCMSPGTSTASQPLATEQLCNNSAGQGGAINEGAVWSGSNLTISPTAGLFGQSVGATSGYLAAGKDKYLNLHQCVRTSNAPAYDWSTVAIDDPIAADWYASTNASNTADNTYGCGAASWTTTSISDVQNLDLLGKRYVNLHHCAHYYPDATNGNRWITTLVNDATQWGSTGTNTSNTTDSVVECAHPSGWTYYPSFSNAQSLDTLTNRYVNIHECTRYTTPPSVYTSMLIANPPASGWSTGTKASNTPDAALNCPVVGGWTGHTTLSDYQVIDTLDLDRGQVFVEFEMTAPNPQTQTAYPHAAELAGTGTGDQTAEDTITVTVDPGIIITETSGSTSVTEGGASDTIQARLTAPPSQDVTVNFTNDNGQLVAIMPITFTPSNWDMPQSVIITANNDATVEGSHTDFINFNTSSSDTSFNGLSGNNVVSTTITDNDTAGAVITVNNDVVSEDGATGEFCIALTSQPSADVTIALSSSNAGEATAPASIVIPAAQWNNPSANCVTVTGVDDGPVGDGVQTVTITTGNVSSTDPNYDALDGTTIDNVTVYNQNNDPPGFAVDVIDSSSGEDGTTATLRFRLLSQPQGGASITIPLSLSDATEADLGGVTSITITNANWNNGAANQVTVTGLNDDLTDGSIAYRLVTGDPTSADPLYDALLAADIVDPNLTNVDNDVVGVSITETSGSTNVTEGGASDTVQVVLNTQPEPGNVVVVNVQPSSQLNVGTGAGSVRQLTFTNANWNTPQAVTINASDDSQLEDDHTALISYSIDASATTEQSYDSVSGLTDTSVAITDNDPATASVVALDDAGENPADDGHFRVTLSNQNSTGGPITVTYSVGGTANSSDYTSLSGSVVIPNGATSADIDITTAGKDDNLLEGSQTVIVTITDTDSSLVTIDGASDEASINIVDDETQTATASLQVTQQGSEAGPTNITYQVVLTKQNETGVPINFDIDPSGGSATAGSDYADFGGQTITVPNGATTGSYTATVNDDGDTEGLETVRASVSNPSLADLTIATPTATADLTDNDVTTATVAATDDAASEDPADAGQFTITLSAPHIGALPLTITYAVSGSADAGADFAAMSGEVEIPVGADSATITVDTSGFDDSVVEGDETVIVTFTGTDSSSVVLGTPVGAVVVIADSDTAPPSSPPANPPAAEPEEPSQPEAETPAPRTQTEPTEEEQESASAEKAEQPAPKQPDTDSDGISDKAEDEALNNGDGNGDGIPDKQQSNVASLRSSVTGKPVTLAVTGDCNVVNGFKVLSEAKDDPDYTYPHGLFEYELGCAKHGQSATVTVYLDAQYNEQWTWRKFNRFGLAYATVGDRAQFDTAQVGSHTVTTVTYLITDGDDLDEDGKANGVILDPSGPGVQTANSRTWIWGLLPLPATLIFWLLYKKRRHQDRSSV